MPKGFSNVPTARSRRDKVLAGIEESRARRATARTTENRLLRAAQRGDAAALEKLLRAASGPAWRFSRGFCRDPHDAEDLVQDVLVTLMRTLASFRGDASLSTWTYVVARRACARRQRRSQRIASGSVGAARVLERRVDPGPAPSVVMERRELAGAIEAAIRTLPEVQKQVVVMRDVEGLSAAEVAEVLGIGERAVKSRLHRARTALRIQLAPFVQGGKAPPPAASCPDTARLLSRYLEGELDSSACARMETHVQGCASCGGVCDSLRAMLGACRAYGSAPIPAEVRSAVRKAVRALMQPHG